jgi:hypothetical protein
VDDKGVWYIMEVFAQIGMREEDIVEKYVHFLKTYPIDAATIETISFQRNIQYALEKRCQEEKIFFPYLKLPSYFNAGSKKDSDMKIRGLATGYAVGQIMFRKDDREQEILLDQLWSFPRCKKDDRIDSLSQHLHLPIFASVIWKTDIVKPKININVDRYGYKKKNTKVGHYI